MASKEAHPRLAVDFPAFIEGEAGVAVVVFGAYDGFALGVDDGDVGVGADLKGTLLGVEAEDAGGVFRHAASEPGDGHAASGYAFAVGKGRECLDAGGAEGDGAAVGVDEDVFPAGLLEGLEVGGVVAADGGDVAEFKAFPHGGLVGAVFGPEGWADLGEGTYLGHFLVGQEEILGASLGPNPLALGPGPA